MDPVVSIVIPVYNAAEYLRQCIESLINQTYRNLEIILVDDGSTDPSPEICDEYALGDNRVAVIHKSNGGASSSRKAGIERATGAYLMFVDSDDWLEPVAVSELVQTAEKDGADCVLFSYVKEFKNASVENYLFEEQFSYDAQLSEERVHQRVIGLKGKQLRCPERIENLSTLWGKLYRSHTVKTEYVIDEREIGTGEDTLFNVYALGECKKISYVHTCFYHYRKYNANSLTSNYIPGLSGKRNILYRYIDEYICKSGRDDYKPLLRNRIACGMIGLGINEMHAPVAFCKKVEEIRRILKQPEYIRAFRVLEIQYCSWKWRIFFLLCRYRCAFALAVLLTGIELIRNSGNMS